MERNGESIGDFRDLGLDEFLSCLVVNDSSNLLTTQSQDHGFHGSLYSRIRKRNSFRFILSWKE